MAISYNPRIVTSGLTLYLDAGNTKSYLGSGTNWADLSGNSLNASGVATNITSTGAISGNPWSTTSTGILNTDFHSIFFMLRMNSSVTYPEGYTGSWEKIFSYNAGGSDRSPGVWRWPSDRRIHWRYDPSNTGIDFYSNAGGTPFILNTWYYVGVTKNGSNALAYVNGINVASSVVSNPKTSGNATIIINESYINQLNNINCVIIYNRVLSQSEIQQNFNALRGRFGI